MLGYALERQGKLDEAYKYFKLSCDEEQDLDGCQNLGVLELNQKGNRERATERFCKCPFAPIVS